MSTPDQKSNDTGGPRGGGAWQDAQKQVRERNDEARRVAKQQRAQTDRREAAEQLERDARAGVYR